MVDRTTVDRTGFPRVCCVYHVGNVSGRPLLVERRAERIRRISFSVLFSVAVYKRRRCRCSTDGPRMVRVLARMVAQFNTRNSRNINTCRTAVFSHDLLLLSQILLSCLFYVSAEFCLFSEMVNLESALGL